jgi:hypothetical protein
MAETARTGAADSTVDVLTKRQRIVTLEDQDGTVVVGKWSLTKGLALIREIMEAAGGASAEFADAIARKDTGALMGRWMEKAVSLVEMSVRDEDRPRVRDLSVEDFLAVLVEVLDLNPTERLLGKAKALGVLGQRIGLVKAPSPTPSA